MLTLPAPPRSAQKSSVFELADAVTCVPSASTTSHASSESIVFDVDGTVTLNDGIGHVGNVFDQSFIHPGVCAPVSRERLPHT